jgi:rubrerythrin
MPDLTSTATHRNLIAAFADTSQNSRRFLWFAQQADIEGYPGIAVLFRSLAEGETGHALGHLEFLADAGDPVTGEPIGDTEQNLNAALARDPLGHTTAYVGYAATARDEGLGDIADWFETLAQVEQHRAQRLGSALDEMA